MEYLSEKQLSEEWGIPIATLRKWRASGRGPRYVKLEGAVRYCREGLDAYLKEHQVRPQEKRGKK
jgi:hypothetical protein